MKTLHSLALVLLLTTGCATITGDPVTVNAEKATRVAVLAFDGFLELEYENRTALAKWPEIRKVADHVRSIAPDLLVTVRNATKAYKRNKTQGTLNDLSGTLLVLNETTDTVKKSTIEAKGKLLP